MSPPLRARHPLTRLLALTLWLVSGQHAGAQALERTLASPALDEAQIHFYSARYPEAAAVTRRLLADDPQQLATYELHTAALHFQIRRLLRDAKDKKAGLAACVPCAALLAEFMDTMKAGRTLALSRLTANAADEEARFLLSKIDLNYVWLVLSTLERRTGWNEYQEARRSIDAVLDSRAGHVRARVARAWIYYIVATKLPWGTRWMLGGGNRGRGLRMMREAAMADATVYEKAEAVFGLWEMEVREENTASALTAARVLLGWFPENQDVAMFVASHGQPRTP